MQKLEDSQQILLPRLTDITKVQIRKETLIGLVTGQHNSHIALRISSTSLQQCWSSTLIIHLHEAEQMQSRNLSCYVIYGQPLTFTELTHFVQSSRRRKYSHLRVFNM